MGKEGLVGQRSILIVEDDDDIRESLVAVLDSEGFRTHTAVNGREALNLLSEGVLPSLILLDVMMPVMDGREFLKARSMSDRLSRIPVAVLTAGMFEPVLGVVQWIRKPVELGALLEVADRYATDQS